MQKNIFYFFSQHELRVKTRLMKYWKKREQLCIKLKDANEKACFLV